ncbi:hypothetical protein SDC9_101959 [bioreactor metagenome]|uniref:Uncharacterized protein n=1 Tax=bioreactor metagenome TaxID=1076179 RepID=A0A645AQH7_9ZZZZ
MYLPLEKADIPSDAPQLRIQDLLITSVHQPRGTAGVPTQRMSLEGDTTLDEVVGHLLDGRLYRFPLLRFVLPPVERKRPGIEETKPLCIALFIESARTLILWLNDVHGLKPAAGKEKRMAYLLHLQFPVGKRAACFIAHYKLYLLLAMSEHIVIHGRAPHS